MCLTAEEAEQRWREQMRIEAERRADNNAAAVAEYQKKKAEAALRQAQQKEATQKHGISEDMIASIGVQLRDCRIFVSDEVVRSVAGGALIHYGSRLLSVNTGLLKETKAWKSNRRDRHITEHLAVWGLLQRWQRAIKKKKE